MHHNGIAFVVGETRRGLGLAMLLFLLAANAQASAIVPSGGNDPLAQKHAQVEKLLLDGRYQTADEQARALLAETERTYGADSLEVAAVLNLLVRIHGEGSTGSISEMRTLAERAVRIHELPPGPENPRLANSMRLLAIVLQSADQLDEARSKLEAALQMELDLLEADDPQVANTLDELGIVILEQGDVEGARAPILLSLEIRRTRFGPDHVEVAESLMSLGVVQLYRGEYQEAQESFEQALEIRERHLRPNHPKIAGSAHNLAIVLQTLGDIRGARDLYERALTIRSSSLPLDRSRLARLHIAAANNAQTLGDFSGAIAHYQRAFELQEHYLPADHTDRAITLTGLGHLLQAVGDHRDAMRMLESALEIRQAASGPDDAEVASSLTDIGWLYLKRNDSQLARTRFEQALSIYEALPSPSPPDLALALLGLACSLPTDMTEESERLLARSLEIYERAFGSSSPKFAYVLANLAEFRYVRGELKKASEAFDRALKITEQLSETEHPFVVRLLHGQARALAGLGHNSEALKLALDSVAISGAHLDITARALPERQALAYASVSNETLDIVFSIMGLTADLSGKVKRTAWDALVRVRGAVMDEMVTRHRYLLHASDPVVADLARSLQSTRQELANLLVRRSEHVSAALHASLLSELRTQEEEEQRGLAEYSAEFRRQRARANLGFKDVASRLPEGWALVAYARFNRYDPSRPENPSVPSYVAFALGSGDSNPAFFTLGAASQIEAAIAAWKTEAAEGYLSRLGSPDAADDAYLRVGTELRKRIWDPFAPHITGARRVLIVPDGSLHLVNFAALPTARGRYVLDVAPPIHLLTTESDIVPLDSGVPAGTGLLALGGADFNAQGLDAPPGADEDAPGLAIEHYRGPRAACPDLRSIDFTDLPATRREVEEVATLWMNDPVRAATPPLVLTGAKATESAFKRLASRRQHLHVATHGFFLGEECARSGESLRAIGGLAPGQAELELEAPEFRPLLLSGLALAGANNRNVATPDEDDGILTSEEIATMQLEGVEWIVLSACDTGIGPVQAGEGVFGLRRAFRIAGARTLFVSLWRIGDESTREWINALYDGRFNHGMDAAEAVRHASRTVVRRRRDEGLSTHPLFWAGLVATGDWR